MFLPKRMTRYVLSELLTPTLLGLLLYTFVLLMNHFFLVAEKALAKNLGLDLTLRLFFTGIPNLMVLSIPMAVLLGSLIAVGRISADQEWVALQSAGKGPWALLRPLIYHGLAWSLACFLIYAYVVPRTNYAGRNLRGEVLFASNLAADLKPRLFQTLPDAVLFVDEIRAGSKGSLEGVLLVRTDPRTRGTQLILAREGDLYPAPDRSGTLFLDLYDGVGHKYQEESPVEAYHYSPRFRSGVERFDPKEWLVRLLEPPDRTVTDYTPQELAAEYRESRAAMRDLEATLAEDPRSPHEANRFLIESRLNRVLIEIHQRAALPLAALFFSVLSLPLGIARVRSGKGAGFALSLLVILVYWATFTFCRDQALMGRFPAVLGTWAGNLVIMPWALIGLWRMRRPSADREGWVAKLLRLSRRGIRALRALPAALRRRRATEAPVENGAAEVPLADLAGTSNRFVGRLDQYVATYFLRVLAIAVASAYLIYALVELKTLTGGLLKTQQPFSLVLAYYPYFAPGVLYVVLPIACLISGMVTFTLLTRSGELTAIKASGISVRRATFAVILITTVLCVVLFLVQGYLAPGTNRKAQEIKDRVMGNAPRTHGLPTMGRWAFGPQGKRLYHYRLYDEDRGEFQGFSVFTLDRQVPRVIDHRFAERARWSGENWELDGGWFRTFPDAGSIRGMTFERHEGPVVLALDAPEAFAGRERRLRRSAGDLSEQMSNRELREQIASIEASGYDATKPKVAYHGKIAHSFSPLVMLLLGLPFAFLVGRRGSLYGIGVGFLLVLIYWAVLATFNALGLEAILVPWVAAWAPNVLFALLGAYLMLFVRT